MKTHKKVTLLSLLFVIVFAGSVVVRIVDILGLGSIASLTLQAEAKETLVTIDDVNVERIDIRYINKKAEVTSRPIVLYTPKETTGPIPLVYVPHYAVSEGSLEWQTYLSNGWAVASGADVSPSYNGQLTTDDLVFNNAALYTLRNLEAVDKQRIALVGGSAGGYTTLMLDGLQMGTTASIANSPVANMYFTLYKHFEAVHDVNKDWKWWDVPIPIVAMVNSSFTPNLDDFPDRNDPDRWEKLAPIGLTDNFSSPIVINHNTGDTLVPIDQITKRYTYDYHDGTLPETFSTRMAQNYPGILSRSLEEQLPVDSTSVERFVLKDLASETDLPYRSDKRISINVFDDGPVSAKGSHGAPGTAPVALLYGKYLKTMFDKGLANTEVLSSAKLRLLLERYQGKSLQLPAHTGVDDSVYGSLAIYQKEIIDQLSVWAKNHSVDELDTGVRASISGMPEADQPHTITTWNEIRSKLK